MKKKQEILKMKNVLRRVGSNLTLNCYSSKRCQLSCEKYSTAAAYKPESRERREKHPYKKIHPWKSFRAFSESLVENVIYNRNGLVALNKPYGIASRAKDVNDTKVPYQQESLNKISGAVDYAVSNSLPFIADKLGYAKLIIVRSPERFMSGVMLLAADESVEKAIIKSQNRAIGFKKIPKTYWIVTTRLPKETNGIKSLALKLHRSPCKKFERPVIHDKWSNMQEKRGDIKVLNVEYNVLSNSIDNLSALIEIKSSTTKWHAIRLFAATNLLSPILGDRIHAQRIQNIMGTLMKVNPFVTAVDKPPRINQKLFTHLNLSTEMQDIIPVHIHLKRIELSWYFGKNEDLMIEAPLTPEFSWTCQALNFELPRESNYSVENVSTKGQEQQSVQISQ